jgi:serine/threonine-protein kinase HipA
MARRKAHVPLDVLINGRLVGRLEKAASGAIDFQYGQDWLAWEHRFAISLSLPLSPVAYRGVKVAAVFDNLLPDREAVRRRLAERMAASGTDFYSLLEAIGRDCVGAMQFLPEGSGGASDPIARGEPMGDAEIEALLGGLAQAPLGLDRDDEFRISVAGAQEKTALLRMNGQWFRPSGATPTTHILKPQLGQIPTSDGMIDMSDSVDNEHYCMRLLHAFGLQVARTEIATFGARRVLVVERFDRHWRNAEHILRLPQEDCCQALGISPTRKYQSDGGPNVRDVLGLLQGADEPQVDQPAFFKSQILFWLIGATDGHAKNFSIFLKPGGGYSLTPFYDVLSAQPAVDKGQITPKNYRLAMSAGTNRHYRVGEVMGRHFVQTGKAAGISAGVIRDAIIELLDRAPSALARARAEMPEDFAAPVHTSIDAALEKRMPQLASVLDEL